MRVLAMHRQVERVVEQEARRQHHARAEAPPRADDQERERHRDRVEGPERDLPKRALVDVAPDRHLGELRDQLVISVEAEGGQVGEDRPGEGGHRARPTPAVEEREAHDRMCRRVHRRQRYYERAIQPRSSARLCRAAVTAGSVRYETTNRRRRIPIGTAQATERVSGASPAFGSRRSAGLSAHDTMTNIANTSGVSHAPTLSPASRWDATAPENWKKEPAYAHSLIRGNLGAMMTAAPPICQTPVMKV